MFWSKNAKIAIVSRSDNLRHKLSALFSSVKTGADNLCLRLQNQKTNDNLRHMFFYRKIRSDNLCLRLQKQIENVVIRDSKMCALPLGRGGVGVEARTRLHGIRAQMPPARPRGSKDICCIVLGHVCVVLLLALCKAKVCKSWPNSWTILQWACGC